jgi:hypothetical protein
MKRPNERTFFAAAMILAAGCDATSASETGHGAPPSIDASSDGRADGGSSERDDAATGSDASPRDARPDADGGPGDARAACAAPLPDPKTPPPSIDVGCFTPTFEEEFFAYDISSGPLDDGLYPGERWFNGTQQCCMSPSGGLAGVNYPTPGPNGPVNPYSLLPGGGLQIRLQRVGNTWMSGVMSSVDEKGNGFSQQYGYIEFNAQLAPGTGTWPALWMLSMPPHAPGGEIDILEQYGLNPPLDPVAYTQFQFAVHDWTAPQRSTLFTATGLPDLTYGYHRFGLLWSSTFLALYFDGALLHSTPTLDVAKRPYYLLADMGLGSGWDTSQTPSPSDLRIKWIRAWSVPGL